MSQADAKKLFAKSVVVTEKMDGGNVTLAHGYFHARSTSDTTPLWERYAKSEWAKVAHTIPYGWRISAESLWARRSIAYDNLPGFLMVIGIWDETNSLLSWEATEAWASLFNLPTVPVIADNVGSECEALRLWREQRNANTSEGFVVRSVNPIQYNEFALNVGKWVRENHVTTSAQWRHSTSFPTNSLIKE